MMFKNKLLILFTSIMLSSSVIAKTPKFNTPIGVCSHIGEFIPYAYYKRENGKLTDEVIGLSVDVIKKIMDKAEIDYEIKLIPWKRCLSEVKRGEKFHIVAIGTYTEERAKKYIFSTPFVKPILRVFYSSEHHPQGIKLETKADLSNYRVGTILGYSYQQFNLDKKEIKDISSTYGRDYDELLVELERNEFDVFLSRQEVFQGLDLVGKKYPHKEYLTSIAYDWGSTENSRMIISDTDIGRQLKVIIDQGIREMAKSGDFKKLENKYNLPPYQFPKEMLE